MSKKLYVWTGLDQCDPTDEWSYHRGGSLMVITDKEPHALVPEGTGNEEEVEGGDSVYRLPEPDLVIDVADDTADLVQPFPNAGCC